MDGVHEVAFSRIIDLKYNSLRTSADAVAHSQTLYDSLIGIDCYLFGGIFISYRPERVNWRPTNTLLR